MISGLDHVLLGVRDISAATDGYRRLFGVEPQARGTRTRFQFPNAALELAPSEAEGLQALSFAVDDLDASARLASRRGLDGTRVGDAVRLDPARTGGLPIRLVTASSDLASPAGEARVAKLDHVVVLTPNVDRALAVYGAKLGLDLRLDRENPKWDARQLFFRCGDAVIEIGAKLGSPPADAHDRSGGLAWRVDDPYAAQARIADAGFDVSDVRVGRKPGTHVFTVRDAPGGVPTLMLSADPKLEAA